MNSRTRILAFATALAFSLVSSGCNRLSPRLFSVAHGNGRYVAVGEEGVVVSSTDLKTWTEAESGISTPLTDVGFGNGRFVAVGEGGVVLVSEDGLVWTGVTTGTAKDLNAITFYAAASLWISVGGSGEVSSSTDGLVWTVRHTGSAWLSEIAVSENLLLAVEAGAAGELSSADGLVWTRTDQQPLGGRCGVAYGNGTWISVDYDARIHRRPGQDSSTVWQTSASGIWTAGGDCDVAAGDGFFAVVDAYEGTLFTSPDGLTWTKRFKSENALRGLVVVGDEVVAVGSFGEVAHAKCPAGVCGDFSHEQISVEDKTPGGPTPGAAECAHWSCGSSMQCRSVMGDEDGTQCEFEAGQSCQEWCTAYIPGNCSCY